jgi:hypothetical protein
MNKKLSLAVASAVLAFGASAANAGIVIPAGDWTVDISGNINTYVTHVEDNYSGTTGGVTTATGRSSRSNVQSGTLSSALGIGGKTRQNDLDIGFQFTLFADTNGGTLGGSTGASAGPTSANGINGANIRQAYLTVGDKSWGSIKAGRDIGLFGSEALLNDMALLGTGGAGNATLAHVGSGYIYADWVNQVQYTSPNWSGFSFAGAVRAPMSTVTNVGNTGSASGYTVYDYALAGNKELGYEGKIAYDWSGDVGGSPLTARAWFGALYQKQDRLTAQGIGSGVSGYDSWGAEFGGKASYYGFDLLAYYYNGNGLDSQVSGTSLFVGGVLHGSGVNSKDEGGYVQGTYKIPTIGTKIGVSYGVSDSQYGAAWRAANESYIVGAYHPLTKNLNLVAEYTNQVQRGNFVTYTQKHDVDTFALGAILFF